MKPFCSHLQSETCWSPWRVLLPGGPISKRVVGEDAWLAAWQWRPQPPRSLWRPPFTSIHTIFMLEWDFPSKNKPPFKEKTIDPPQQIPANLPVPEAGEERLEWWTPAPLAAKCVWVCPCATACLRSASYSIRLSFNTSLMHPVLHFHSSNFQHPSFRHCALSSDSTSKYQYFLFSHFIYFFYCVSGWKMIQQPRLNEYFHPVSLIKTAGSTQEWPVIVCQLNTRSNMTQSIIWLSIFIFLAY